jgi:hypothetical protein
MIKGDLRLTVRRILLDRGLSYEKLASTMISDKTGEPITRQTIAGTLALFSGSSLSPAQVRILEALGYDVELKLVKRKDEPKP